MLRTGELCVILKDFNMSELLTIEKNKSQLKLTPSILSCLYTALIVYTVIFLISYPLTKFGFGFKKVWVENGETITIISFPSLYIAYAIVFIALVLLYISKSKSKAFFLGILGVMFVLLIHKLLYLVGFADFITKSLQ